jgi:hypothetical protein
MKLKGKSSRARTKLANLFINAVNELSNSELALIKEYGELDESGEPIKLENGNYKIKPDTVAEFNAEHLALLMETAEVSGATYAEHLDDCIKFLNDYDGDLAGDDAVAYDSLLDALESEEK